MAETTSQINITEPSADVKPFLEFLRNAAFGMVFTPQALQRSGLPGTTNLWGNLPTNPQTTAPATPPVSTPIDVPYEIMPVTEMRAFGRQAMDQGSRWQAHSSRMAEGGLARSAAEIEKALADVLLSGGGSPIGGTYPTLEVSPPARIPMQIGTGTQTPPPARRPNISPLPAVIATPPSGTLPVQNPNPTLIRPPVGLPGGPSPSAPPAAAPPAPAPPAGRVQTGLVTPSPFTPTSVETMFTNQRPENFAGAEQAAAKGYNPNQYADQSVAEKLAQQMGGNLQYTNVAGPIGPPSQATLNFGGGAQLNAGLVNRMMTEENQGLREMNLQSLRDEIKRLGGTATFAQGGTVRAQTGMFNQPEQTTTDRTGFNQPSRMSTTGVASTTNAPATTPPANPFGQAPPEMMQGVLNPYQRFQGQRVLSTGANFGQVGAVDAQGRPVEFQVSDPTRAAFQGLSKLPSYFDEYGNVRAGRTEGGTATTNLGIANDIFDVAGNQALSAAQNADTLFGRNDVRSSFQDTMDYLRRNPSQFQAGDITLGQLESPQLNAPLGVTAPSLTSFQMEGPQLVDTTGANINPLAVMGPQLQNITASTAGMNVGGEGYGASTMARPGQFIDTGVAQSYMSPYQQNVIDEQLKQARRAFDEQRQVRNAQAVRAGAFGGSRQAVAESIAERDLANQQQGIVAQGLQNAFENAQAQFERDRAAGMTAAGRNQEAINQALQFGAGSRQQASLANQALGGQFGLANLQALMQTQQLGANLGQQAQQANQQAALEAARANQQASLQSQLANQAAIQQARQQNLGAALGVQELGAQQALAAQQANQGAGLTAGQSNLQAALATQQLGRTSGLSAAQANQQTRLAQNQALLDAAARADQLAQQAAQSNAANRISALGQQTQSALAAGQIGQSRADLQRLAQAMELQNLQALQQGGANIDARTQQLLDLGYQDFINQRNFPYQQLNFLAGLLNNLPQSVNQEQVLFQRTNPLAQIGGLATAGLGALQSGLQR